MGTVVEAAKGEDEAGAMMAAMAANRVAEAAEAAGAKAMEAMLVATEA